ncbi:hypothetical protein JTE90_029209 [Oedothorax gibbosus]|uniref:Uncharacterized protein n=1 Tax=Oedothorax gibbosus TaxID=931172 RepID=A0AAV6VFB1_9ARAC|nr:hypothetical protein JTE90_029209 [Oedothorax gibbosus]
MKKTDDESEQKTPCPEASIYKDNEYDEALNPFASEDVENNDSILKNSSITVNPQQTAATVNGYSSLVPLVNVRKKGKSTKKYRAPDPPMTMRIMPSESAPGDSEISGPVPLTVKVDDYDEALNPFASEDEEAPGDNTGNLPSNPAQPFAYSSTSVNVKRKNAKSLKKRRAPDLPVIESTKEGSAIAYAGSSYPATIKVELSEKETCPSIPPTSNRKLHLKDKTTSF